MMAVPFLMSQTFKHTFTNVRGKIKASTFLAGNLDASRLDSGD